MSYDPYHTPQARVRGLGSAKHGHTHWVGQRLSAISLVFLGIWFIWVLPCLLSFTYQETISWMAKPHNFALLSALVIALFYHAALGAQVVIEDYFKHSFFFYYSLIKNKLGYCALAILSLACLIKILILGN